PDPVMFEKNEKVVDSSWLCIRHWTPRQVNAAGNMNRAEAEGNLKSLFCDKGRFRLVFTRLMRVTG
ncbi:hypothetical protein ACE04B_25735, partial [Rhizobium phaseoli]